MKVLHISACFFLSIGQKDFATCCFANDKFITLKECWIYSIA